MNLLVRAPVPVSGTISRIIQDYHTHTIGKKQMKTLKISDLYYKMLVDIAKQARKKTPEEFIELQIKNLYEGKK